MSNITNLQTDINTALSGLNYTMYYTVTPDGPVYPHLYIYVVSDNVSTHKNWKTTADISTVRVQIEVRATSQISANTIMAAVYDGLKASSLEIRPVGSTNPIIWESKQNIYRAIFDFIINYS